MQMERRENFIGAGLHFKFRLNGTVKVVRDYLKYFDWKKLISDAGITETEGNDPAKAVEGGIKDSNENFKYPKPSSPPISATPVSVGSMGQEGTTPKTPTQPHNSSGSIKERKNVLLPARRMSVNGGNSSRICSSCGTSKTPYWRDGWGGPVVLCNACGLRYQKFKKYCWTCKYIPRKEEHSSERCANCKNNWK